MFVGQWKRQKRQKATGEAEGGGAPASEPKALTTEDVAAAVAKGIQEGLAQARKDRTPATDNVRSALDPAEGDKPVSSGQKHASEGTGINLARMAKAYAVAKMTGKDPADVAKGWGYDYLAKALSSTSQGEAGFLMDRPFSSDFIELLRPRVFVRQYCREVPLKGTLSFRKQRHSGSAHYTGEADVIEPTQPGGGEETMKERELTSLSVINNTLIKNASVSAEEFVRDDMLAVKARREQIAFLRGDGANNTPRGIFNRVAPNHRISSVQAGGEATLQEIRRDVSRIMTLLKNADAPMLRLVWVTNPTVEEFLYEVTNDLGIPVYESLLDQGKWARGLPFETTNQLPSDINGDESELACIDFSEVILGQGEMFLDVFPNGTYEENGTVKSGISRNQTVIRLIDYHDIFMRHEESGVVCNVKYGN